MATAVYPRVGSDYLDFCPLCEPGGLAQQQIPVYWPSATAAPTNDLLNIGKLHAGSGLPMIQQLQTVADLQ